MGELFYVTFSDLPAGTVIRSSRWWTTCCSLLRPPQFRKYLEIRALFILFRSISTSHRSVVHEPHKDCRQRASNAATCGAFLSTLPPPREILLHFHWNGALAARGKSTTAVGASEDRPTGRRFRGLRTSRRRQSPKAFPDAAKTCTLSSLDF